AGSPAPEERGEARTTAGRRRARPGRAHGANGPAGHIDRGGSMDTYHRRRGRVRGAVAGAALATLLAASLVALPSYAADEELIVNGGFEDGTTGWFANNGNATDA